MADDRSSPNPTSPPIGGAEPRPWLRLALPSIALASLALPLVLATASHRRGPNGEPPFGRLHPALAGQASDSGSGSGSSAAPAPAAAGDEPIAYVGHGGFFDGEGRQIVPTAEFVAKAQDWYRERLAAELPPETRSELAAFERRLLEGVGAAGQAGLVLRQRSLDWMFARSPRTTAIGRMRMKTNALAYRLAWKLPLRDDLEELRRLERFELSPAIEARLKLPHLPPGGGTQLLSTNNQSQAYLDECAAADVPIPPAIGVLDPNGTAGWRSLGFIPPDEQFITGTPAEVRVFESPKGLCMALPRYTGVTLQTVKIEGVICLSRTTSKVCFWDSQMGGNSFLFSTAARIPIGVPNLAVNINGLYLAGGAELESGGGGVCTSCHAGENPYIIHPNSLLRAGLRMGDLNVAPLDLPTFGPDRYIPLGPASWPQNELSQAQPLVPSACSACHTAGGTGGRLPHLSSELGGDQGYCGILKSALSKTMPPTAPGSLSASAEVLDLLAWCDTPAGSGPSGRGDPHLITTNGVHYDFQAAGEFVALRNSATGLELQTRQTPVLTTATPGVNAHTGLASCVSLNTAAALRVGRRRISYQPGPGGPSAVGGTERMELRIDGERVSLPPSGIDLGGGNRIARAAEGGGLDIRAEDGSRVIITPNFWASEGYWFLNVEVLDTPAREGTMGHVPGSSWLPLAPDGSSFGPKPASLSDRHFLLNRAFADAWRVRKTTSLFDYDPGTSTATFTNRSWPPPPGSSCAAIKGNPWPGGKERKPVEPMRADVARRLCRALEDRAAFEDCVFDLTVMGNPAMADAYKLTLRLREP